MILNHETGDVEDKIAYDGEMGDPLQTDNRKLAELLQQEMPENKDVFTIKNGLIYYDDTPAEVSTKDTTVIRKEFA